MLHGFSRFHNSDDGGINPKSKQLIQGTQWLEKRDQWDRMDYRLTKGERNNMDRDEAEIGWVLAQKKICENKQTADQGEEGLRTGVVFHFQFFDLKLQFEPLIQVQVQE